MFDTFRGLCMWSIPCSHFTRMAGEFSHTSFGAIVYITINVFVMQSFMFLSGYFSKKPEKSRKIAFKVFLWPYLLSIPFFYFVRMAMSGYATFYLDRPPFAMWFMLALFLYKLFQMNYIKIPHCFAFIFIVYLFAGCMPFLTEYMSLGRIVSYFPFFVLGYYCQAEHVAKIKSMKRWKVYLLGVILVAISVYLAYGVTDIPVEWYLMRRPGAEIGVAWYADVIGRLLLSVLGCAWIIFMMNFLPSKDNYLAYVGRNTMPVYIFHLVVRQWIKRHGIGLGLIAIPSNPVLYYVLIYGLASLCVVTFSSKPVVKFYDFCVDGSYAVLMWLLEHIVVPAAGYVELGLVTVSNGVINAIGRDKK